MAGRLSCRRRSCLRWRCCPSLLLPARPPRRKTNTVGVRVAAPVTPAAAAAAASHALILLLLRRRLAAEKIGTPQYHRRLRRSGDHHGRLPHPTCSPYHRQQQRVQQQEQEQEVVAGSARTVRESRRPGLRSASGRWLMKGIVWC